MQIQIGNKSHHRNWLLTTEAGQDILKQSKGVTRPRCACLPQGAEMYIATRGNLHYLARMPGTASQHSENCSSHIVPSLLYSKDSPKSILSSILSMVPDIKSLKWADLRVEILNAAQSISVDGEPLSSRLFLPEFFKKDESVRQRKAFDEFIEAGDKEDTTQRRWLIAPIKNTVPTKYGAKADIKHLPGVKFWCSNEVNVALTNLTNARSIFGIYDVKKSSSGVIIVDAILYNGFAYDPAAYAQTRAKKINFESANISTDLKSAPLPQAGEEEKIAAVCQKLDLPVETPRREIVSAMIEYCLAH